LIVASSLASDPVVLAFAVAGALSFAVVAFIVAKLVEEKRLEPEPGPGQAKRSSRNLEAYDGSPMLRRAIEVTANLADRRGVLGSVERSLRAADVPMRPAEVIFAYALLAILVPGTAILMHQSLKFVALAIFIFVLLPPQALKIVVKLRRKKFVAQLPDALTTLAGALRAGRSLVQALDALAREMPAPMGRELRKIVAENRLGRPLYDALDDAVERVGSPDFRWAVLAIQIQAEVGGNLAELLNQVAETMRARNRLQGEVKALTAEGRASAGMLVVMPPALGLMMFAVNPSYMDPLFSTGAGKGIIGISTVMMVVGFLWMKKVVTIRV
jgi:tight adherence protein B